MPSPVKPSARPQPGDPNATASTSTEAAPPPAVTLREAVAKMTMTILMYSDVRSERMVFINDRKYVEGESVEGYYLIESITQEGAVLSYHGERAILRPKAK
jgi:hypothetical protein